MTFIFYALMGRKEIQMMVYGYARVSTKGQAKDRNSVSFGPQLHLLESFGRIGACNDGGRKEKSVGR